jgi:NCAIR mutase (PurE)-related protein
LAALLTAVAEGKVSPGHAARELSDLPFTDLGFAKVDHHRELRQGMCEIVLAEGKSVEQVIAIVAAQIRGNEGPILVTRAHDGQIEAVKVLAKDRGLQVEAPPGSRAVGIIRHVPPAVGRVLVVTAGTSDLPVAEEAALTAKLLGAGVEVVGDVGVAGLHRISAVSDLLPRADCVVVVAGMEGALASVVGGLATCPVIACPTSVGYGASFGGLAALLAMLSSCTPGVVCVNIDDGVGAGFTAALVATRSIRQEE